MKKIFIISLLWAFVTVGTNAQGLPQDIPSWNVKKYENLPFEGQYVVEDTAHYEIIYAHAVIDPVLKKKSVVREMLALGMDAKSIYKKYADYQLDSLMNASVGTLWSFNEYIENSNHFDDEWARNSTMPGTLINDYKEGRLKMHGRVFGNSYLYQEPIEEMAWTLQEGSREILGYECSKATLSWRGRDWTAWYTPEIPYSEGPWKFHGLPGLILRLEDATGEHKYQAVGFKKDRYPFGFSRKALLTKTTRKKFEEVLKDNQLNMSKKLADSDAADLTPEEKREMRNRRLFYNPIELE